MYKPLFAMYMERFKKVTDLTVTVHTLITEVMSTANHVAQYTVHEISFFHTQPPYFSFITFSLYHFLSLAISLSDIFSLHFFKKKKTSCNSHYQSSITTRKIQLHHHTRLGSSVYGQWREEKAKTTKTTAIKAT